MYQCNINRCMRTVFTNTNDCCRKLESLTTLYKLHTHWDHAKHQWCQKESGKISSLEILTLTRLNISAACCNEALYSPMIDAEGWLGPLPRSDNPSQPTYTLGRCQTSMMCRHQNVGRFLSAPSKFSPLQDSISVHHVARRHGIHQWLMQKAG